MNSIPEDKVKKNNDYSASANITNNITVKELLDSLHTFENAERNVQQQIKAAIPEHLTDALMNCQDRIRTITEDIRKAVDELGSFQDVEAGHYAVKMRLNHVNHDAEAFERHFPGYVPAVIDIVKSINKVGLKGLIKSGKLTEEQLRETGVVTESETFRYIIE